MNMIRRISTAIGLTLFWANAAAGQGNAGQLRVRESYRSWAQNASRYGMWAGLTGAVVGSAYAYNKYAGQPDRKLNTFGAAFVGFAIGGTVGVVVYEIKWLATRNKKTLKR